MSLNQVQITGGTPALKTVTDYFYAYACIHTLSCFTQYSIGTSPSGTILYQSELGWNLKNVDNVPDIHAQKLTTTWYFKLQ